MSVLNWLISKLTSLLNYVIALLPVSPFRKFIDEFSNIPYLGYLNWFFPVGKILEVGAAWLAVIALFYIYSVIMRWVKLIGD